MHSRKAPALAAALAALLAGACGQETPPTRVVLITLDTLRLDALAGSGHMPETESLAARGVTFERFFATTSTTQPTHASLFTGLHPWGHGVSRNGVVLAEEHLTLAEHLRGAGFATHAVVASFPLHEMFGFAQGFDTYEDDFDQPYVQVWEGRETEGGAFFSLAESVTDRAIDVLDGAVGERQFFWFHYFDPHDPYGDTAAASRGDVVPIQLLLRLASQGDPGIAGELERARSAYARDLAAMDRALGRLYERLRADEGRFETHVILTSDHGESFGERGALGHGKRVTREQVQVPLVLVSPRLQAGVTRDDLASSVDLPRTVLALVGLDPTVFGGRSLDTAGEGGVLGMRRRFAEPKPELLTDGRQRALPLDWFFTVRDGVLWSGNATTVRAEDAVEAGEESAEPELREVFAALSQLLDAGPTAEELLDPEVQERLRKLGYTR
jgi:arylsulfatase A-like enzyme